IAVQVPVMVLRETTERPELLEAGGGILVGTDPSAIGDCIDALREDEVRYVRMRQARNPFGDGHAAEYIGRILEQALVPSERMDVAAGPRAAVFPNWEVEALRSEAH